ncbi:alpha-2-macroglobulin family protein [Rhodospirillum centenum]|uniref:Alpha-2-macroglobulin family protein n=1 Tax=Rhodospirillum centenum (strain ATCC 51521 / SW) TaxID=414684 RepID=B6IXI7_RHOCS|nr:alpha-2-macroglobulin [Rhodospirillum centenum]ACJ01011.1 conserved hypothetical protein [Rhodospirillum centenum SW]
MKRFPPRLTLASLLIAACLTAGGAVAQISGPGPAGRPAPPPAAAPKADSKPPVPAAFGITGVEVAAERDRPQVCFRFNRDLPRPRRGAPDLGRFVNVAPAADHTVVARDRDLCLEGLGHGQRFTVTLGAGLPTADGTESLAEPVTREVAVPDRKPMLTFRGQGYILPRVGAEGLPLRTVNVERARLQIMRINDRALVERIYWGRMNQSLTDFDIGILLDEKAEIVWKGEMTVGNTPNRTVVTPFPIDQALGALPPGVYVAVAENAALPVSAWDLRATQWFVVSDIGLTSFRAGNGLFVFARSLGTADPLPGVELRLVARGNQELGRAVTGPDGLARFDPALLSDGEKAPQALFATAQGGDFSLLDFGTPAVELGTRGAGGRAEPGPLDAWLATDRTAYRPGGTVHLTALLRDPDARAVTGRSLTLRLSRPDGLETARLALTDGGEGGYSADLDLPATAPAGRWSLTAHERPDGPAIGRAEFQVGEVAPARLDLSLNADRRRIAADGKATLYMRARLPGSGAASGLPGELALTLRPAAKPYPGYEEFRFGLAQEDLEPQRRALPGFVTRGDGGASAALDIAPLPETSRPLEAVLRATVYDTGGRPAVRELVLPVDNRAFALGIRPSFAGDAVPEGATVSFDIVALAPDGQRLAREDLSWELYEEDYDYQWYEADGRWDYRATVKDRRLTGGTLDVEADRPGVIEEQVKAGRYRLEVFDPVSGTASSVRFSAGWWVSAKLGDMPDAVDLAVMEPLHQPGGTARVFVRPPYDSTVLVTVADRNVRHTVTQAVGAEGAFLDLPLAPDLTSGAYVLATAFAPADPGRRTLPRRAVGVAWVGLDPAPRTLGVEIAPPEQARSGAPLSVPVTVTGLTPGQPAHLVLFGAGRSLVAAGTAASPDPAAWFLGKRRLTVQIRDVYGRLLETAAGADPAAPDEGRPVARPAPQATAASDAPVTLYSGIVTVGADGRAEVPVRLPEAEASLRLTAIAWSADKLGRGEAGLEVRDPVVAGFELPGVLAVGDSVSLRLSLENVAGPRGSYMASLVAEGPVAIDNGTIEFKSVQRGRRVTANRTLTATAAGEGALTLTVTGPEGFALSRTVPVVVRPVRGPVARSLSGELPPGGSVAATPQVAEGLLPDGATVALSVGPWDDFDMAALLLTVDPRGHGSAEQMAARLLPLLVAGTEVRELGLLSEEALKQRVGDLIDRLVMRQRGDGAYAQWTLEGPADPWLTAFVLDVLTRAREAGHAVPEAGYRRGLDWLVRTIGNAWVDEADLPGRAYALYAAARAKVIDAAPVRYFYETHFAKLPTRLARAQVAGAFALLGDGERAAGAFAQLDLEAARTTPVPVRDYGSDLRDRAGALALLAAGGADPERLAAEVAAVRGLLRDPGRTSAQERAWLILAARELAARSDGFSVSVDGTVEQRERPLLRRLPPGTGSLTVENTGERPLHRSVTAVGLPAGEPEAAANGFELTRTILDRRGRPVDLAKLRPGDLLAVVLEGRATQPVTGPVQVVDTLPAGFAGETLRLAGSSQLGDLSWIGTLSETAQAEFQEGRFTAALDPLPADGGFRLVYLVRASVPGRYALPPARVEDQADPDRFARTAPGTVSILAGRG